MKGAIAMAALASALATGPVSAAERAFCPGRPGKATPSCTVDAGRVQVEVDLVDSTWDRTDGVRTTDLVVASPQLRLGLTDAAEFQLAWVPYERQTTRGPGVDQRLSGVGDVVAGMKLNLTGNREGVDVALLPFVKLPTARRGIGNGLVEGGVVAPMTIGLPAGWSLGLSPELDLSANDSGAGRHVAGAAAASLGHGLGPNLTVTAELWAARDFAPGAAAESSADLMMAWAPPGAHDLQVDVGVNFGLTRATPATQAYAGIAKRF